MKSLYISLILLLVPLTFSCTKVDNYAAPDAGINGTIIDNVTKSGIQTEQPDGIRIRLLQSGYENVIPIDFWVKSDGSFENKMLFSGTYKVIPIEGAFLPPDTAIVTINKGITTVNFNVTPFLNITASEPTVVDNDIIIHYTISEPAQVNYKIVTSQTMAANVPAVSQAVNDYTVTRDLSGTTNDIIVNTQFTDTLTEVQKGTYYVRVGATTNNALGKYNYSKVFPVTILTVLTPKTVYNFADLSSTGGPCDGTHSGIDFGTGVWNGGDGYYGLSPCGYFKDQTTTSATIILPAGDVLKSIKISGGGNYNYTISDGVNPNITGNITANTPKKVTTNWTKAGNNVTIATDGTWDTVFNSITYSKASSR
jgi:hypothetical protein